MSYIRPFSPYFYVDGYSDDYIFMGETKKGETFIEDYEKISNETIVDLLMKKGIDEDNKLLFQLGYRLSENLKIKLRKKKLTDKQWFKLYLARVGKEGKI